MTTDRKRAERAKQKDSIFSETLPESDVRRISSRCLSCILGKALEKRRDGMAEEEIIEYQQRIFGLLGSVPLSSSPSEVALSMQEIQKDYGFPQADFKEIKSHFNRELLRHAPGIQEQIAASEDPLKTAIQFSVSGNYIDFGMPQEVEEARLQKLLQDADSILFSEEVLEKIRGDLEKAGSLVLLHDNCGEIVLDKLLLETIHRFYPKIKITAIVRGEEVKNDVTMRDAGEVDLASIARVLPNGDGIGGTCIDRISEKAKKALYDADLILSKGQGNFETLRGCGLNVYYLFLCKCDYFSDLFKVPRFTGMVVHEQQAAIL